MIAYHTLLDCRYQSAAECPEAWSADEIEQAERYTPTLSEALRKLRPFVTYQSRECLGPVRYYVNGHAIPTQPRTLVGPIWVRDFEELRYVDCFDPRIAPDDYPASPRFYIVLRPGVVYEWGVGTHPQQPSEHKARP